MDDMISDFHKQTEQIRVCTEDGFALDPLPSNLNGLIQFCMPKSIGHYW